MKNKLILISILLFILTMSSVSADGCFFSPYHEHLSEPFQKAVIYFDGSKETMELSAAVRSENISNFAWVVPIQSYSKPEVSAGNMTLFEDIVEYFFPKNKPRWSLGKSQEFMDFNGVTVLESKEIDVYDIVILQATNSSELINWLNSNEFLVADDVQPMFDKYIRKGNYYFIANKIDLDNKYEEDLTTFEEEFAQLKSYNVTALYKKLDRFRKTPSQQQRSTGYFANYLNTDFFINRTQIPAHLDLGSKDLYIELIFNAKLDDDLEKDFYYDLEIGSYSNPNTYSINRRKNISDLDYLKWDYIRTYKGLNLTDEDIVLFKEKLEDVKEIIVETEEKFNNNSEEIKPTLIELKEIYDKYNLDYFKNIEILQKNGLEYYVRETARGSNLSKQLDELRNGFATPLRFEFYPPKAYFPLEISSLNRGFTIIDVYVVGKGPVYDENGVLKTIKTKLTNKDIEEKLKNHLGIEDEEYITLLGYDHLSKDLFADAVFGFEEEYSFWKKTVYRINEIFN